MPTIYKCDLKEEKTDGFLCYTYNGIPHPTSDPNTPWKDQTHLNAKCKQGVCLLCMYWSLVDPQSPFSLCVAASFGTGSMSMPSGFGNSSAYNLPTSFSGTFQQQFPGQPPFPQPQAYPQQPNGGHCGQPHVHMDCLMYSILI